MQKWLFLMVVGFLTVNQAMAAEPTGRWKLKTALCEDGQPATINFNMAELTIDTKKADLLLSGNQCLLTFKGTYTVETIDGREILNMSFNQGTWTDCSGLIPAALQSQMEWKVDANVLTLTGVDLFPMASCDGMPGQLIFDLL